MDYKQVEEKVAYFISKAKELYSIDIDTPTILFDLKGTAAGKATPFSNVLSFNKVLLEENIEEYMSDTIPHEVAHLVCHKLHGWIKTPQGGISHHGKEWKSIMLDFGCNPTRCHNLDTSRVKRKMRSFSYICPKCKSCMKLSAIRHNRINKGKVYTHKTCNVPIEFIEEIK